MADEQQMADSGDFQQNPAYGMEPQSYGNGSTYEEDPNQLNNQQPEEYEQYAQPDAAADEDANNPFAGNGAAPAAEAQPQYEQQPPPYSQDPPAAYATPPQETQVYGNGMAPQQEPEDVVAQMEAQHADANDDVDYGNMPAQTADSAGDSESGEGLFGNAWLRKVFMASALLIASFFAMILWFDNPFSGLDGFEDFDAGWGLSATGAFFMFFGAIGALVVAVMQKLGRPIPMERIVGFVVAGLYIGGGTFYFIGGCAVAAAYNGIEGLDLSYIAGIFFVEETFVGAHAILAGVDLLKPDVLNRKKWRVLIYNAAFLFLGVIGFFAYAVTSTTIDDNGGDNAGPALAALFYFVVDVVLVVFLIIFLIPKLNETLGKPIVLLILSGVFAGSCVMLLIAYFVLAGEDVLTSGGAYFVGVGFFVLACGAAISFDMFFERFIPGYKDGGDSVSDAQNQSAGMPTNANEPDTP